MNERTSSAAWLRGVSEMFEAEGLNPAALFAAAGLEIGLLTDSNARYSADAISILWELAVSQSGNATLGLTRELASKFGNLDLVGYAMASSSTLLDGLKAMAHSMAVVSDAATFAVEQSKLGYVLTLGHVGNRRSVPRQRTEFGLLTLLMLCNWLTRQDLDPLAAGFAFPAPQHLGPYKTAFQCELRFDQPTTFLLYRETDLNVVLPSHNPSVLAVHEQLIADRLRDMGKQGISEQVRKQLTSRMKDGEPKREDVARFLLMTDRTLQRRLREDGTCFRDLLDEVRVELAHKHLADNHHPLAKVSELLGFVDQSNFFRACKRWFGVSPGLYRSKLADQSSKKDR